MSQCIQDILNSRGFKRIEAPLWKLKVNAEEFNSLKSYIRQTYTTEGKFDKCKIEAALYYAEWYKRECVQSDRKGGVSREDVYKSLGLGVSKDKEYIKFYDAAVTGLKAIPHHDIINTGTNRTLYSLLYQGGIPLKNICSETASSNWDRFIRGLILRDYDFSALQNESAESSKSLKEYCDTLKDASEQDSISDFPFCCDDEEGRRWFEFLTNTIKKTREKINREHPFRIGWEFDVDEVDKDARVFPMNIYYRVTGPQTLSEDFLESNGCTENIDNSISVNEDYKRVYGETYYENFIHRKFFYRAPYKNDTHISVQIDGASTELESASIDMNIPHIAYWDTDGLKLGNRLGSAECRIFLSADWTLAEDYPFDRHEVSWFGNLYSMITVPSDYHGNIECIHSITGESVSFTPNTPLYWTEIYYDEGEYNYFKEHIYKPGKCKIYKASEAGKQRHSSLIFRERYSDEWSKTANIGKLYARPQGNVFISPVSIYNLGEEFAIDTKTDNDSFEVKFDWKYGKVKPECGVKGENDYWRINKDDCGGKQFIACTFIPEYAPAKSFTLHLKTQFFDFAIYDINGEAISNNDFIPVCDVNLYTYDFKNTANSSETTINFTDSKIVLDITHHGSYLEVHNLFSKERRQIPPQGSLDKLLGNMEVVKHEVSAHNNYLKICFNGLDKLNFIIRHRPFKIEKDVDNNLLRINELSQQNRHTFKGDLFLFPLDGTRTEMTILKPSDNGIYPLPIGLPDKYLVCEDNYTSTSGRLEVRMHTAGTTEINRGEESKKIQQQIIQELRKDSFGTERWKEVVYWLDQTYKYSVPASKLHDLKLCGSNDRFLVMMALHAYMLSGNTGEDKIIEKLLSIEDSLRIKWWAIKAELFNIPGEKVDNTEFKCAIHSWLISDCFRRNDFNLLTIIASIQKEDFANSPEADIFKQQALDSFKVFMTRLAISSFIKGSKVDVDLALNFYKEISELIAERCNDNVSFLYAVIQSTELVEDILRNIGKAEDINAIVDHKIDPFVVDLLVYCSFDMEGKEVQHVGGIDKLKDISREHFKFLREKLQIQYRTAKRTEVYKEKLRTAKDKIKDQGYDIYNTETIEHFKKILGPKIKFNFIRNISLEKLESGKQICRFVWEDTCGNSYNKDIRIDRILKKDIRELPEREDLPYIPDLDLKQENELFGDTGEDLNKLHTRIETLANYLVDNEDRLFYHGEDISNIGTLYDNPENNCKRVRESIIYYLDRDRDYFLLYLRDLINRHKS